VHGPRRTRLPDGRTLAWDDVGDPGGAPVLYLHGTPDSRLARHPDDAIAAELGIRLLAVDRPGAGESDVDPDATLTSIGDDLRHLLDELALERVSVLAWSAGGFAALAAATVLGDRLGLATLVATVPPVEAYADPAVVEALGPARRPFAEMATELAPAALASELAPYLVPRPLTADLALEHVLEGAGEIGRTELAAVPGAASQLALALQEAVRPGLAGLEKDLELQLTPGLDLAAVRTPIHLVHGSEDGVSPPAVGAWLAARLVSATVEVVVGGGHHRLFPAWRDLLDGCRP
jgi:pimeloyl-ACP methyl ester carboxylesterase